MEAKREKQGFGWGWLIIGILFIITAVLAFYDPAANLEAFAIVFAIMAIVHGIWLLALSGYGGLRILFGILDILAGVFMLFNIGLSLIALPFVFAIWFIIDSVFRLLNLGWTKALGTGYFWLSLILNVLGVIVGILLLFSPVTAALTLSFLVGFYLMMVGVECIVVAFA
ncbi:MAG: HdeD family acid-resistance protein [Oscillospiraceae bacterium]